MGSRQDAAPAAAARRWLGLLAPVVVAAAAGLILRAEGGSGAPDVRTVQRPVAVTLAQDSPIVVSVPVWSRDGGEIATAAVARATGLRATVLGIDATCAACASVRTEPPELTRVAGTALPATQADAIGIALRLEAVMPGDHPGPAVELTVVRKGDRHAASVTRPLRVCAPVEQCDA